VGSEIEKPRLFANWKPTKGPKKRRGDDREGMSDEHCRLIRKLPCSACGLIPAGEIHHLKSAGGRGMGLRAPDKTGVPLCRIHHIQIEDAGTKREVETFQAWGIANVHALAKALWNVTGDSGAMARVLIAHRYR
jgi:hypothetical protein